MKRSFILISLLSFLASPLTLLAATDLEISGWIPYWRVSEGTRDARNNIEHLDTINPFGYIVESDGELRDEAGLKKSSWKRLFRAAKSNGVEVIPTVMWSNGAQIHAILSDEDLREDHIEEIDDMIDDGRFDGVDIDYEAKLAETKDYFSLFLKELKEEIGESKILSCTIEARTPPDSLYTVIPPTIRYANDLQAIGTYCDRVQIMAYDQGRADIKLNAAKKGMPYTPVADADWVRKSVELMALSIPREKIMLGVPTYGYEYELTVMPDWFQGYRRLWSLNPGYAVDLAEDRDIAPTRDQAGELSFSYFPDTSPYSFMNKLPAPPGSTGNVAAAQALLLANTTGLPIAINHVVWSDAGAIEQKIELAEELGLRGVSIFKIDGGEDEGIWDLLDE